MQSVSEPIALQDRTKQQPGVPDAGRVNSETRRAERLAMRRFGCSLQRPRRVKKALSGVIGGFSGAQSVKQFEVSAVSIGATQCRPPPRQLGHPDKLLVLLQGLPGNVVGTLVPV